MTIILFGADICDRCKVLVNELQDIPYVFVDANAEDDTIQKFCDMYNVDKIPHLVIVNDGKVIFERIGEIDAREVREYFRQTQNTTG